MWLGSWLSLALGCEKGRGWRGTGVDMKGLEDQSLWLRLDLVGNGEPQMVLEQERCPLCIGLF